MTIVEGICPACGARWDRRTAAAAGVDVTETVSLRWVLRNGYSVACSECGRVIGGQS